MISPQVQTETKKPVPFFLNQKDRVKSIGNDQQQMTSLSTDTIPVDDGFVSFSNNCLTRVSSNDLIFLNNEEIDDMEGFREYSASFLSCSSILPQSTMDEDTLRRRTSLPLSDINDLIGDEEESDLDRTLNNSMINEEETFVRLVHVSDEEEKAQIPVEFDLEFELVQEELNCSDSDSDGYLLFDGGFDCYLNYFHNVASHLSLNFKNSRNRLNMDFWGKFS